jgi:plasmid maintenance system antidote protein VapI
MHTVSLMNDGCTRQRLAVTCKGLDMQRELPMHGSVTIRTTHVPEELIHAQPDMLAAVNLCIQLSGLTNQTIAERLGLHDATLSRITHGRANLPLKKLVKLMDVCGNRAPVQYLAWRTGMQLTDDAKAKRKAELEAELRSLAA